MHSLCPLCSKLVDVPAALEGREVVCPWCRGDFIAGAIRKPPKPRRPRPPVIAELVPAAASLRSPGRSPFAAVPQSPSLTATLWRLCAFVWFIVLALIAPPLALALALAWFFFRKG